MKRNPEVPKTLTYDFDERLIAHEPANPRDSARLLVYEKATGKITHSTFRHLSDFLPKKSVLVFNETKVIPARFEIQKSTGGRARGLFLESRQTCIVCLSDRRLEVGDVVESGKISLKVKKYSQGKYLLEPKQGVKKFLSHLRKRGVTPLPPYIKSPLKESERKKEYQTVFAKHLGSVAAPTASLHFTRSLLGNLKKAGIQMEKITLHVGLGTFAKVTEEQVVQKKLHQEYFELSQETAASLNKAKKEKRPIIAVGTTVARTLESAIASNGIFQAKKGTTRLFIQPGDKFRAIDGLITNFHVPESSLLMLVAAFIGEEEVLTLYREGIGKKYRLFSFGDGMLLV